MDRSAAHGRGNVPGSGWPRAGYEAVAERVFSQVEAITCPNYELAARRRLRAAALPAKDKGVGCWPGVLEDADDRKVDDLRQARDEAAKHMRSTPRRSPQCGWRLRLGPNAVTEDDQKKKLALVRARREEGLG